MPENPQSSRAHFRITGRFTARRSARVFTAGVRGLPGRKDADVGVPDIADIGSDGNRKAGMPDIKHLRPEQSSGLIVQDKLVHESQGSGKKGNLPADPPDPHHCKPHHFFVQY